MVMAASEIIERIKPAWVDERNFVREAWDLLHPLPGGRRAFSRLVGQMAPYTATIAADVRDLRRGHSEVVLKDRRGLRNHLSCLHAIALANLAELTGNLAVAYSMPDDARFIVAGMNVDYLKKARGTITATCDCVVPETSNRAEYEVEVEMRNGSGVIVAEAQLKTLVGPKKRR